jgi:hypothetical protein
VGEEGAWTHIPNILTSSLNISKGIIPSGGGSFSLMPLSLLVQLL